MQKWNESTSLRHVLFPFNIFNEKYFLLDILHRVKYTQQ